MENKHVEDKPRFNLADAVIIIVILAIITAFALRIYNIFGTEEKEYKIKVDFKVTDISSDSVALKKNAKLYSAKDNSEVGYLESFTVSEMVTYAYNDNGELVKATVPGKSTVTGTIVLTCTKTDKGYYLGGSELLSEGGSVVLYTSTRELEFGIVKIHDAAETTGTSASTAKTNVAAQNTSASTTAAVN